MFLFSPVMVNHVYTQATQTCARNQTADLHTKAKQIKAKTCQWKILLKLRGKVDEKADRQLQDTKVCHTICEKKNSPGLLISPFVIKQKKLL